MTGTRYTGLQLRQRDCDGHRDNLGRYQHYESLTWNLDHNEVINKIWTKLDWRLKA